MMTERDTYETEDPVDEARRAKALWCAVINQALDDACGRSTVGLTRTDIASARIWLTEPNRDFAEACALADMDPERVRQAAIKIIAESDAQKAQFGTVNRTRHKLIEHEGRRLSMGELALEIGVSQKALRKQLAEGKTVDQIIAAKNAAKAPKAEPVIEYNGKRLTLSAWAKELGVCMSTIKRRLGKTTDLSIALHRGPLPLNNSFNAVAKPPRRSDRRQKLVEHDGVRMCISSWASKLGISIDMLGRRLRKGEAIADIIASPSKTKPHVVLVEHNGKSQNVKAWADELGVTYATLLDRINKGHTIEHVLATWKPYKTKRNPKTEAETMTREASPDQPELEHTGG